MQDSGGGRPSYNLRTLGRSLEYAVLSTPLYGLHRATWDGFEMSFATQLDASSRAVLHALMVTHLLQGNGGMLKVCGVCVGCGGGGGLGTGGCGFWGRWCL